MDGPEWTIHFATPLNGPYYRFAPVHTCEAESVTQHVRD